MRPGSASATHLLRQSPPARARPSTSSSHSGSASRPRTVRGPTSAAGQLMPALTHRPSADLPPSSSGPAAARCRRATACWAACQPLVPGAQLAAGDRSSSAAATETKAPASRSPITGPRRTAAAARAGPQLHPGALLRPAELPEALPAAALVGLQHRGGLGPPQIAA
jgi:hypothetical protein